MMNTTPLPLPTQPNRRPHVVTLPLTLSNLTAYKRQLKAQTAIAAGPIDPTRMPTRAPVAHAADTSVATASQHERERESVSSALPSNSPFRVPTPTASTTHYRAHLAEGMRHSGTDEVAEEEEEDKMVSHRWGELRQVQEPIHDAASFFASVKTPVVARAFVVKDLVEESRVAAAARTPPPLSSSLSSSSSSVLPVHLTGARGDEKDDGHGSQVRRSMTHSLMTTSWQDDGTRTGSRSARACTPPPRASTAPLGVDCLSHAAPSVVECEPNYHTPPRHRSWTARTPMEGGVVTTQSPIGAWLDRSPAPRVPSHVPLATAAGTDRTSTQLPSGASPLLARYYLPAPQPQPDSSPPPLLTLAGTQTTSSTSPQPARSSSVLGTGRALSLSPARRRSPGPHTAMTATKDNAVSLDAKKKKASVLRMSTLSGHVWEVEADLRACTTDGLVKQVAASLGFSPALVQIKHVESGAIAALRAEGEAPGDTKETTLTKFIPNLHAGDLFLVILASSSSSTKVPTTTPTAMTRAAAKTARRGQQHHGRPETSSSPVHPRKTRKTSATPSPSHTTPPKAVPDGAVADTSAARPSATHAQAELSKSLRGAQVQTATSPSRQREQGRGVPPPPRR